MEGHLILFSKDHFVTVKEERQLFDSLFSRLLLLREEYNCLFDAEDFSLQVGLMLGLKILIQGFLPSDIKLETGLRKLKWIESQENQ